MFRSELYRKKIAVIVAHPDDETLWAGGILLNKLFYSCFILCLCRGDDPDRAPRFQNALREYGVEGVMAGLDDGPDQDPLPVGLVKKTILELLPDHEYDRVYTHSPEGEYTRHRRHEETGSALLSLWMEKKVRIRENCLFAYEDGGGFYLPRPIADASIVFKLTNKIWNEKYRILREIYGFDEKSFEARTAPRVEAFQLVNNGKRGTDLF